MPEARRLRVWRIRLLMFLAVIGPGFITANVDNDAGGIYTYSAAGAQFGYLLLWVMIPMTVALVVVQEMSARMGAVTGKGLSDLIREEYGLRITFFMMLGLVITNFGNVVAEFAGIASSLELFHISRYISVPCAAVVVWLLVVKGTYKSVEKVFLAASFFYFAYIIAGVLAGPSWKAAFVATFKPPLAGSFLGCLFTDIVAWFIVVACAATLYVHGIRQIRDAADAAQALRPLAGEYAYILFAAGLFNASLFAASILPISTAYTVCEGLGFESGVGHKFKDAKVFYWLYTLLLIAGGAVILLPNVPLIRIAILSQVVNGIVLPFVLIFMLLLINKSELMGKYVNGTWFNFIAWATTIIMIGLTIAWFVTGGGS